MRRRQTGGALLVFMLLMIVGTSFVLVTGLNEKRIDQLRLKKTQDALSIAKEALISYALTHYDIVAAGEFGFLPCPDASGLVNLEGAQDATCGGQNVNSLGRLPWSALDIEPVTDGDGECLWYAVSSTFKKGATASQLLNEDTNGSFQLIDDDGVTPLAGATPQTRPVAVIVSPGAAMPGQDRSIVLPAETVDYCGGNYNPANYLETLSGINNAAMVGAADSIDQFISTTITNNNQNTFNDVVAYITKAEIIQAFQNRSDYGEKLYDNTNINNLTRKVAECISNYGASHGGNNYSMPWPAPIALADYRIDANYNDDTNASGRLFGRVPNIIDDSNAVTGAAGNLITDCVDFTASAELTALWQHWKDHLFYVVAQSYQPIAGITPACGNGANCITINEDYAGSPLNDYAAVVIFSGSALTNIVPIQDRRSIPIDADNKSNVANYLEGNNVNPYADGDNNKRIDHQAAGANFNDIVYCINDDDGVPATTLQVTLCPSI